MLFRFEIPSPRRRLGGQKSKPHFAFFHFLQQKIRGGGGQNVWVRVSSPAQVPNLWYNFSGKLLPQLEDITHFSGHILGGMQFCSLRVEWTEIRQIWGRRRHIIRAPQLNFRFLIWKVDGLRGDLRPNFVLFISPVKIGEGRAKCLRKKTKTNHRLPCRWMF